MVAFLLSLLLGLVLIQKFDWALAYEIAAIFMFMTLSAIARTRAPKIYTLLQLLATCSALIFFTSLGVVGWRYGREISSHLAFAYSIVAIIFTLALAYEVAIRFASAVHSFVIDFFHEMGWHK
jgi:hypothetical protein